MLLIAFPIACISVVEIVISVSNEDQLLPFNGILGGFRSSFELDRSVFPSANKRTSPTHLSSVFTFHFIQPWVPTCPKHWVSSGLNTLGVNGVDGELYLGKIFGNKEMRLLMLGLDAAGKTSVFVLHTLCIHPG